MVYIRLGDESSLNLSDREKKMMIVQKDCWEIFKVHNFSPVDIAWVLQRMLISNMVMSVPSDRWERVLGTLVELCRHQINQARENPEVMADNRNTFNKKEEN